MNYTNDLSINYYDKFKSIDYETFKSNKRIEFIELPISFDIETSSWYEEEEKKASMYVWGMSINGKFYYGRTWEEFRLFIAELSSFFSTSLEKRLVIYVHNLAYEFEWIQFQFQWDKVFAIDERKVCYAITTSGVEFRCSYILSGYSLEKTCEHLLKYKIPKLVGTIDYDLIRLTSTPLTDTELEYLRNDCLGVTSYIKEEIEQVGHIFNIPLTKTSKVRRYVRDMCLYVNKGHRNDKEHKFDKYRMIMKSLSITSVNEFHQLHRAFAGGFTHCNVHANGYIVENVHSYDLISDYIYQIVANQYPMGRGHLVENLTSEKFKDFNKRFCSIFEAHFYGLKSKEIGDNFLSKSKCIEIKNPTLDNGRVVSCDYALTSITNVDFEIFEMCYTREKLEVQNYRYYPKGFLPKDFILAVLKLYEDKTTLKGVEGKEIEYMHSKENLNSCYGMMVTNICRDDIIYDNNTWAKEKCNYEETLKQYNESYSRFLAYQWGIFVTAYARLTLVRAIKECGWDYLYSDTDSIKFINYEKHKAFFDNENKKVRERLQYVARVLDIPFKMFEPETIKGEKKLLGAWDYEGRYKRFKTLGAKRYMFEDQEGELHITISGVNKTNGVKYLKTKYGDNTSIFNAFKEGLVFPKEYLDQEGKVCSASGKMTHTYCDYEIEGTTIDYLGKKCYYKEESFIHLEKTSYSLTMSEDYLNFIELMLHKGSLDYENEIL